MSDALQWLTPRMSSAPDQLKQRMIAAIEGVAPQNTIQDQLAEAALSCLKQALANGLRRESALQLLAADALLTHASEAAMEAGNDAIAEFASRWDASRFESLLT